MATGAAVARLPGTLDTSTVFTLRDLSPLNSAGFLPVQHDAESAWVWTLGSTSSFAFKVPAAGTYTFRTDVYLPAPGQTLAITLDGQYLALANATAISRLNAVRHLRPGTHDVTLTTNLTRNMRPHVEGWRWSDRDVAVFIRNYTIERAMPHSSSGELLVALGIVVAMLVIAGRWLHPRSGTRTRSP